MNLRPEQGGRGRGIAATIEGFFGLMWFGWGTADAPEWLGRLLFAGVVISAAVLVVGIFLAVRSPSGSTPMADPAVRRRYNIIVGIEFATIFVGAALLGQFAPDFIAAWIALVVGVHFVPLGRVFGERLLELSGYLIAVVAVVAGVVAVVNDTNSNVVAGAGTGLILLVTGLLTLLGVRLAPSPAA